MSFLKKLQAKIMDRDNLARQVRHWQVDGQRVVFTNGCFDLLHYGHIHYLAEARDLGDRLVLGLNSFESVRRLKGPHRPINDDQTRSYQLAALECVDGLTFFPEDTPLELIRTLTPDLLVKGGDWQPDQIVGADWVLQHGGNVRSLPYQQGYSTSNIEQKIKKSDRDAD